MASRSSAEAAGPGRGASPLFATAAKGTEPALRDELRELGLPDVRADRGGVHFGRRIEDGWRACLLSRVALRVLWPVARFDAPDAARLYEGVRAVDWGAFLSPRHTLAVAAAGRTDALVHTGFVAQKTKDAIVDRIRDERGARPSVDLDDPDVRVFVHLGKGGAGVWLDMAGESLHRRGWRARGAGAPLKETLAAAVLRLSGWDRCRPLVDPMCGSGTIAIEADLWARGVAPGIGRGRFGFERWASHDGTAAARWRALREEARARAAIEGPDVLALDAEPDAVEAARRNARTAGARVRVARADVGDLGPTSPPGQVVLNPPYGERLAGDRRLWDRAAAAIGRLRGHAVAVLAGDPGIERALRRWRPRTHLLYNGAIPCKLLVYEVR